ncbi:alpha/beta hydrolase fold-domain-containing protein [Hypoxylon rubiginosum]|uniref:Alpha/beta hydrolase fold-domain-containing protein n=1 Tax=Hypoxylon rubiginosum TaxID=110542 RepID=A0ACB9ZK15_9PEZI|nr:alpha/beta hydrolase fold-domain-containing protein [Hypoxylon rubiginosum]
MSTNDKKRQSGAGPLEIFWAVVPKVPLILKVILLHLLGRSESAQYLDLRSDVTISFLRSLLSPAKPRSVSEVQDMTLRDPGVKGKMWVSTMASQVPPEEGIRDALFAAIDAMSGPEQKGAPPLAVPDIVPVEAEWTGYRAGATRDSKPPAIPEEEKYRELMKECTSSTTILYLHGGAYYLCDPATHRPFVAKLAKLTGGRAYSVRYRLAPQHPFPAALLDALVSYFTLLYPPPGSAHEAVAPADLVITGDSAGGNLCMALLQLLLELRRQDRKVAWFGAEREVPLPAAVTPMSPWVDLVQTMPSLTDNGRWDYLPPPRLLSRDRGHQPPADGLWPADPPRRHVYVADAYMLHPLGSLHLARSWAGAPPVYLCCGWETLQDEDRYLASRLARDGVAVVFEEFQAMPHVFAAMLPQSAEARRCVDGLTNFIKAACEDPGKIVPSYKMVKAKTLEEVDIDVDQLTSFTDADVRDMARNMVSEQQSPFPDVPAKI